MRTLPYSTLCAPSTVAEMDDDPHKQIKVRGVERMALPSTRILTS